MSELRFLIAPDKFKGCLTAAQVASAVAAGVRQAGAQAVELPLADGGDGSVAAALSAGSRAYAAVVAGPTGVRHSCEIAYDGHTAVVEVANSCGITLLPDGRLAPREASSWGLGDAMRAALHRGPKRLVVALGGSASTDGGLGMLLALGAQGHGVDGRALEPNARGLMNVASLDLTPARRLLAGVELVVATDVNAVLTGPEGAAYTFAPQKGADAQLVAELDCALGVFADVLDASEVARRPGSGAAGGLGFALQCLGGLVMPGADFFLDVVGFDAALAQADVVVTGEGCFDGQTLQGKLPSVVARRSGGRDVHVVCGVSTATPAQIVRAGVVGVHPISALTQRATASDPELTTHLLTDVGAHLVRGVCASRLRGMGSSG